MTAEQIELLSHFLDALDEWGCDANSEKAQHIADFIAGGFDLSEYEEMPRLSVIDGGLLTALSSGDRE